MLDYTLLFLRSSLRKLGEENESSELTIVHWNNVDVSSIE